MSLNPQYMIASSLQEYFVDKNTGLPLTNGQVFFYSDVNRTVLKNIYTISGSPPNYSYTALPNPLPLSGVGTPTDGNNNDIIIYYYPLDTLGNVELYYTQVFDQNGGFQFTREAWPNFSTTSNTLSEIDFTNYVPNGQFLIHNSNQPLSTTEFDSTGIDYTAVAQGGWYFARSHGSTATDTFSFPSFESYVAVPTGSPRFSMKLVRTVGSSDAVCDYRLRFYDVNKFADPSQKFLFQFTAKSDSGSNLNNVAINLYKYFGTGGSPTSPFSTNISTVNFPTGETIISAEINFGTNTGYTIGTNNDDFLEICINLNAGANSTFDVEVTDVVFTPSTNQTDLNFPVTTDASFIEQSIAGFAPVPNPDGSDLYLYLQLTPQGLRYDDSDIGKIYQTLSSTASTVSNELLCDGTQYKTTDYSALGIPYSRLQKKLISFSAFQNIPLFGTGSNYLTTYIESVTPSIMRICTNKIGAQTAAANGTLSTGFTIALGTAGGSFGYKSYQSAANTIQCQATFLTSSFVTPVDHTGGNLTFTVVNNQGNINYAIFSVLVNARPPAGTYFTFSDASTNYYMWFKLDGAGTDPAIGGGAVGIMVDILSSYDFTDVANAIRESISGYAQTIITTTSGATVPAGSYFSLYAYSQTGTPNQQYVVWYKVNNLGTKPVVGGAIYIEVDILSADTDADIAAKTQTAINTVYFAVPDFRGIFFRIWDSGAGIDLGAASRMGSNLSYLFGDAIGTFEFDQIQQHNHSSINIGVGGGLQSGGGFDVIGQNTGNAGGAETRPINAYINAIIKY